MTKKIIITQSNYIPWKGYFDAIQYVDEVILYDDMQYTKRDWRNRNQIKTPQGLLWLSIPVAVKGKYFQAIQDTQVSDLGWASKHWKTIQANYAKAKFFKDYQDIFEDLYLDCRESYLSQVNLRFILGINKMLGITTPIRFSSDFVLVEGKTERLVDLCKRVDATDYYTGSAAQNYMDESLFTQENIRVHYWDYAGYPEYEQLYPPFAHNVSIIDLILNQGENSRNFMKYL
ncbi:MAG: WbqC family protein [Bernardetiaceae bacterium]